MINIAIRKNTQNFKPILRRNSCIHSLKYTYFINEDIFLTENMITVNIYFNCY